EPAADHVVAHANDRDCLRRALRCSDSGVAKGDDEIDFLRNKLAGQLGSALIVAAHPSKLKADIASLFPADRLHVAGTARRRSPAHPADWAATRRPQARELVAPAP